jgi:hypothetical protein
MAPLKPGDCIVRTLLGGNSRTAYKCNHIYKVLRHEEDTVFTEMDSVGSNHNGWGVGHFRKATLEEAELYDLFGICDCNIIDTMEKMLLVRYERIIKREIYGNKKDQAC